MPVREPAVVRRRRRVKRILAKRNRYQFGQPARTTRLTGGGAVGCTDTAIQLIVWMAKGKRVSQDEVRRRSGGPRDGSRGLRPSEVLRALRSFGLPYEARSDISAGKALRIARNRGPIIIAHAYWSYPQWKGYRYLGKTLRGWSRNARGRRVRVGFSRPRGRSGLTQWTFRGGHAALLATSEMKDGVSTAIVRDSNHNSPVRRERPAWDRLTVFQVRRMMDSIRPAYGGKRLIYVPRRVVVKV